MNKGVRTNFYKNLLFFNGLRSLSTKKVNPKNICLNINCNWALKINESNFKAGAAAPALRYSNYPNFINILFD